MLRYPVFRARRLQNWISSLKTSFTLPQRRYLHWHHLSPTTQRWTRSSSSANIADDHVARLASKPLHPLTLSDLVRHGRPPLSAEALFSSANFTLSLLPIRLAHRIQSLRNLPFIVVSNPHISKIYNNYLHSLSTLLPYTERRISTLEDESVFTEVMADLVQTHSNTIPILARGFLECRRYISPQEVTRFLDEHLRARIGTRLIAEQHIALHFSSQPHLPDENNSIHNNKKKKSESAANGSSSTSSYIGVIDTSLRPSTVINNCGAFVSEICELKYGVRPKWVIDGQPDTTFAYVPVHLEYIITELLKNAFRAVVESGMEREPIVITLAATPNEPAPSLPPSHPPAAYPTPQSSPSASSSPSSTSSKDQIDSVHGPSAEDRAGLIQPLGDSVPGVTIRIRDRGKGISPDCLPNIWSYSFTTFSEDELPGSSTSNGNSNGNGNGNGNLGNGTTTTDALNAISGITGQGGGSLSGSGGVIGGGGSSIAGLGYGLPLGRAYAEYFGGGIAVQSMWGWGTDVYLNLRGVGKVHV